MNPARVLLIFLPFLPSEQTSHSCLQLVQVPFAGCFLIPNMLLLFLFFPYSWTHLPFVTLLFCRSFYRLLFVMVERRYIGIAFAVLIFIRYFPPLSFCHCCKQKSICQRPRSLVLTSVFTLAIWSFAPKTII